MYKNRSKIPMLILLVLAMASAVAADSSVFSDWVHDGQEITIDGRTFSVAAQKSFLYLYPKPTGTTIIVPVESNARYSNKVFSITGSKDNSSDYDPGLSADGATVPDSAWCYFHNLDVSKIEGELTVTRSITPSTIPAKGGFNYTITVSNTGDEVINSFRYEEVLPSIVEKYGYAYYKESTETGYDEKIYTGEAALGTIVFESSLMPKKSKSYRQEFNVKSLPKGSNIIHLNKGSLDYEVSVYGTVTGQEIEAVDIETYEPLEIGFITKEHSSIDELDLNITLDNLHESEEIDVVSLVISIPWDSFIIKHVSEELSEIKEGKYRWSGTIDNVKSHIEQSFGFTLDPISIGTFPVIVEVFYKIDDFEYAKVITKNLTIEIEVPTLEISSRIDTVGGMNQLEANITVKNNEINNQLKDVILTLSSGSFDEFSFKHATIAEESFISHNICTLLPKYDTATKSNMTLNLSFKTVSGDRISYALSRDFMIPVLKFNTSLGYSGKVTGISNNTISLDIELKKVDYGKIDGVRIKIEGAGVEKHLTLDKEQVDSLNTDDRSALMKVDFDVQNASSTASEHFNVEIEYEKADETCVVKDAFDVKGMELSGLSKGISMLKSDFYNTSNQQEFIDVGQNYISGNRKLTRILVVLGVSVILIIVLVIYGMNRMSNRMYKLPPKMGSGSSAFSQSSDSMTDYLK
ncbi:hypothetical protein JXB31_02890 [Candidatus Woesearchaeota archaeon]|nr:hypothetical protein [Candidatus Woesearchaeota archaeon]